MACPALQYFPILSDKRHDFRQNVTENEMCFNFLYSICLKITYSKNIWARYDQKCTQVFM